MSEEEALKELEAELAVLEKAAIESVVAEQEQEPEPVPSIEAAPEPKLDEVAQPKKSSKKAKKEPEVVEPAKTAVPAPQPKAAPSLYGAARIKAKLNRH